LNRKELEVKRMTEKEEEHRERKELEARMMVEKEEERSRQRTAVNSANL
jgi:hypothetical protein